MKRFILPALALAALATPIATQAQSETTGRQIRVALVSGDTLTFPVSQISSISFFNPQTETPDAQQGCYSVAVPSASLFDSGRVQKVIANGIPVAEIDYEYIKQSTTTGIRTVIYPLTDDLKADLTRGLILETNQAIAWDKSTNEATITGEAATEALTTVYIAPDGTISATATEGAEVTETTFEPDLLVDVRGTETITYKITKVATQYWMAENLRATRYVDGTEIPLYTSTQATAWGNLTSGARHLYNDNNDLLATYGYLYNGYVLSATQGIAPKGWRLPTNTEYTTLYTATNNYGANLRSAASDWDGATSTNRTGFTAYPSFYFSSATGDSDTVEAWFWTGTTFYDVLYKTNGYEYFRLTQKSKVISDGAGHSPAFGHAIRLIRE
jgi:uncharacterized protein (TIGR02145 family)